MVKLIATTNLHITVTIMLMHVCSYGVPFVSKLYINLECNILIAGICRMIVIFCPVSAEVQVESAILGPTRTDTTIGLGSFF